MFFLLNLYPSGYNLGHHRRHSMVESSFIFKIPRWYLKCFSMVQPSFLYLLFQIYSHLLLENFVKGNRLAFCLPYNKHSSFLVPHAIYYIKLEAMSY